MIGERKWFGLLERTVTDYPQGSIRVIQAERGPLAFTIEQYQGVTFMSHLQLGKVILSSGHDAVIVQNAKAWRRDGCRVRTWRMSKPKPKDSAIALTWDPQA